MPRALWQRATEGFIPAQQTLIIPAQGKSLVPGTGLRTPEVRPIACPVQSAHGGSMPGRGLHPPQYVQGAVP